MEAKKINYTAETQYNVKAMMSVLLFGGFLSLFNETILNVAFPKLMVEMHVSATTVQWLTTGYMLVVGILVPITAFLIHSFNTKQLFLTAMLLFLAGSVFAVFSPSFTLLLISRMIQATGTGMLVPIMMTTALAINPPEKRGSAMGLCVCSILFGPALGPIVSGALLQYFSWHSLFILLIPLALISIIAGALFLQNVSELTKPKIDYLSIALSTIGFAAVIYGISIFDSIASNAAEIIIIFAIGIISLFLFSKRQLSLKQPMLELRCFKHPLFSIGVIMIVMLQMIQFSMNILLPTMLQQGFGASTLTSALVLFPAVLLNGFTTPISGKIFDKFGGKIIIPLGIAILGTALFILSNINPSTSILSITLTYCMVCLGIALSVSTTQTNSLNQLSMRNQADGVAITNTSMQIAAAIGTPLFIGLMTAGENSYTANNHINAVFHGFHNSITAAVIIAVVSFVLSLALRNVKHNLPDHKTN